MTSPTRASHLGQSDRRALQAVAVQFFVNGVIFASFIARLPELRDRLDLSNDRLGIILGVATLGGLAGSTVSSRLLEHNGAGPLMLAGGIALALLLPAIGLTRSAVLFAILLALVHVLDVIVDVAMNLQGSRISARAPRPVINRLHGLWSLGTVVGGVIAATMAALGVSLPAHLATVAALLLAAMAIVRGRLADLAGVEPDPATVDDTDEPGPPTHGPNGRGAYWTIGVLAGAALLLELVGSDWSTIRLTDDLSVSADAAGIAFVAYTSGMFFGRFSGDLALASLGSRRLMLLGAGVGGLALLAAAFAPTTPLALLAFFVAGLGNAVLFPQLYDAAAKAPGRPGAGLGALTAGSRIGALAGPSMVGILSATDALSVGGAMAIVSAPAMALVIALTLRTPTR